MITEAELAFLTIAIPTVISCLFVIVHYQLRIEHRLTRIETFLFNGGGYSGHGSGSGARLRGVRETPRKGRLESTPGLCDEGVQIRASEKGL